MNKTIKACAWVMSPINVIECLIALQTFEKHMGCDIALTIYNYYPTDDKKFALEIYDVVSKLVSSYDKNIPCEYTEHNFSNTGGKFDLVFYAHDVVGNFLDHLMYNSPDAQKICYGDAMGQLFDKHKHLGLIVKKNPVKAFFEKIKNRETNNLPEYAILTIPVAQVRIPQKTKLIVPDHATALSTVSRCANSIPEIYKYSNHLIENIPTGNAYLFMTENIAEGRFMTFEKEMDFYCNIIAQNCPKGSTIIIKPHPGEQYDRTRHFEERLGDNYTFFKFEPAFKRYPIEIFYNLLKHCTVISMFYPALSLKYLFDMDVIQPMTNAVIEKYFAPSLWESYKNAIELNMAPLRRLKNWDGKSLLYNGR